MAQGLTFGGGVAWLVSSIVETKKEVKMLRSSFFPSTTLPLIANVNYRLALQTGSLIIDNSYNVAPKSITPPEKRIHQVARTYSYSSEERLPRRPNTSEAHVKVQRGPLGLVGQQYLDPQDPEKQFTNLVRNMDSHRTSNSTSPALKKNNAR